MPPRETLSRVEPLLAGFGVSRVARHTGLDFLGVPVWCAYTPNSRSLVIAQGKGLSDLDAKVSAVMEALERAVAGAPAVEPVHATARDLLAKGRKVETLNCLIGTHGSDLGPDDRTEWAVGKDLLTQSEICVPLEAALLDRTRSSRFWMSSDGLASGNTLEEAILHGLLERIERDAYVLWQVSSPAFRLARCIDPHGFDDPILTGLVDSIEAAGLILKLFDITSDIDIPCFAAVLGPAHADGGKPLRFVEVTGGSGAHPSPIRAALRAVTEAAQSRLTYISGARDDLAPEAFSKPVPGETLQALAATPRAPRPVAVQPRELPQLLEHVLEALRERQVGPAVALPLSNGMLPFSVAKIFVPALENPEGGRARRFGSRALSRALLS
ncbi:YcaO-like family protein [Rhizobium binxianense]